MNLFSSIEGLETCLREYIRRISEYTPTPESSTQDFVSSVRAVEDFVGFVEEITDGIYGKIVLVSNVLEDGLRTIYISSDDATLEGFATELETQLSQLRLLTEGLKELPGQTNGEFGEILTGWLQATSTVYKNIELAGKVGHAAVGGDSVRGRLSPGNSTLGTALLFRPCRYVVKTGLKTLGETCMKILSVLSMISGKWEQKIAQRVDAEDIEEGMIMASGRKIRRGKKSRGVRSSDIYH